MPASVWEMADRQTFGALLTVPAQGHLPLHLGQSHVAGHIKVRCPQPGLSEGRGSWDASPRNYTAKHGGGSPPNFSGHSGRQSHFLGRTPPPSGYLVRFSIHPLPQRLAFLQEALKRTLLTLSTWPPMEQRVFSMLTPTFSSPSFLDPVFSLGCG